ncbi:acetyl-CoA carboxylase biotin carboxyl carrier protein subunit [Heliobacterium gestii]|uniref:Acetyl-CoA carboxylase biotin carboxyl carrier protein subunit n=1 Tax=Heliomicrobium gestii TaxID=2699 RepID=A0A845LMI2_HELGE|nr:acetyl-CoA carboxylase biotin carboxyl carrier protein subunit [Heliomicrobium gestii]MBM7867703.1 acetyl-CoA carboxylase biotin carboxyl carrier protein [Heliomicrobium gestii]MZP44096.1 acetyl-CoA carboxylase biotin carboxyl carrier protein subunit [Heliomicrobium gestii]
MKEILADMTGTVFRVEVRSGAVVQPDQDVVILESMKMEIPVQAKAAGTVVEVRVVEGDFVNEGDVLMILE